MNGTGNGTGQGWPQHYQLSTPLYAALLTLEVAIALFGALGNLLVCIVITKRANMKTTMNLYLRNLAVADMCLLCFSWPVFVVGDHGIPFEKFFCLYIYPVSDMFYGASIWSITVIAIERYRNIISRRSFGKRRESFKKVTLKILLVWLTSFLVVAVPLYAIHVHEPPYKCYPKWPEYMNSLMKKTYVSALLLYTYIIPMAIIVVTYSKISSQLKQSTIFHKGMHGEESSKSAILREEEQKRLKQNKKAKRILTPLVLVFATTMFPLNVFRLLDAFYPPFQTNWYFLLYFYMCVLCQVVNSAVDPLVYYISSKEFRKVLQPMLSCSPRTSCEGSSKASKASNPSQPNITKPETLLQTHDQDAQTHV